MPKVIQISGKKRHGKDTIASILMDKFPDAILLSFAEPMKQIIATTLGITLTELDELKNTDHKVRGILQRFGSEAMKAVFGEDVWAELLKRKLLKMPDNALVIITDWRFNCEVIEGSLKLRVNRPTLSIDTDAHRSELELDDYKYFDYILENVAGINELEQLVYHLIPSIKTFINNKE